MMPATVMLRTLLVKRKMKMMLCCEDVESEEKLSNTESDSEFIMIKIKKKKNQRLDVVMITILKIV